MAAVIIQVMDLDGNEVDFKQFAHQALARAQSIINTTEIKNMLAHYNITLSMFMATPDIALNSMLQHVEFDEKAIGNIFLKTKLFKKYNCGREAENLISYTVVDNSDDYYYLMVAKSEKQTKRNINYIDANKNTGKHQYNYVVKAHTQSNVRMSLSNYVYGLSERVAKQDYPFLNNIGTADQEKAILYIINNTEFDSFKMIENLNKSKITSDWHTFSQGSKAIQLEHIDPFNNISYLVISRVLDKNNSNSTDSKTYAQKASEIVTSKGIRNYRVNGKYLTWNVSYPETPMSKRYTIQYVLDMEKMKTSHKQLQRYDKKGEINNNILN